MLEEARWLKGSSISAGTRPVSQINPLAVHAMSEVGIDISGQKSKIITEDMIKASAKSVNMGCVERAECPMLFINNVIDWGIEDPKGLLLLNHELKRPNRWCSTKMPDMPIVKSSLAPTGEGGSSLRMNSNCLSPFHIL